MNASKLLVECLENEGVEYVFGVPGEEMVFFLDSLKNSSIELITTADERAASFMAAGHGRLTGKPGVVATTLGPGALNIPNGLAFATLSGFPLVALTWQSDLRSGVKANGFQYVDTKGVLAPVCKYTKSVTDAVDIPLTVREAFKSSRTPKCGSSHIQMYENVALQQVPEGTRVLPSEKISATRANTFQIRKATDLISQAKTPLVLAGVRSSSQDSREGLQKFVKRTDIHIITTPMAQGVLADEDKQSLTSFVNGSDSYIKGFMQKADLVITVGYDPIEYSPDFWNGSGKKRIVHVDSTSVDAKENFNPKLELVGDIKNTLFALNKELSKVGYRSRSDFKNGELKTVKNGNYKDSYPINPHYLISKLNEVADDTLIVHDNGMHKLWMTRYFKHTSKNQVLIDNTLASMGSGIPQGIVAKLLNREKDVLVNVGDGGFLMSMGELSTVASLDLPLTVLVWNDGGYGMIKWHQENNSLENYGVSTANPDFTKIAESFGGVGVQVEKPLDLTKVLREALSRDRLTIIDCPIDYSGCNGEFRRH